MTDSKRLMPISDYAKLKKCSRRTIYNNMHYFKIEKIGKFAFIIMNQMANDWQPDELKQKINRKK